MEEEWRDVVGYEGLYKVSNLGNVKSLPKLNGTRMSKEKILKHKINKHGYHQVCLCKGKLDRKYPYVHRLVANAFIERLNETYEVNHIDGNKDNNKVDNLEWTNHKDNIIHGWKNGLMENVRDAPAIHFGYNCRLVCIKTGNIINFESYKELSRFLEYNEFWLSKSIRQGSNYQLAARNKGYQIILE